MSSATRPWYRGPKVAVFVSCLAIYVAVGYWLQVTHGFIMGDTLSRVAATQAVLFSRDPHLAALGFIFPPLAGMVQILPMLGDAWFPDLAGRAFAGTLMSAPFMAGAAVQIFAMGADRGLRRDYTWGITALFALNPMIIFYGSNGMTEAPFLFFITLAVRRLILWMSDDDPHHLIVTGAVAMTLAYLTRYDGLACVAAAGVLVFVTTYRRAQSPPRGLRALLDMLLVAGPGVLAFLGWALTSWLITGEALAQFTSQYGNTAILEQSGQTASSFFVGLGFAGACVLLLAPTLIPLLVWAVVLRWRWPTRQLVLVPLTVFGAALVFQAISHATGTTFPFLRFFIVAIPLTASLALLAVPDGQFATPVRPGRYAQRSPGNAAGPRPWAAYAPAALAMAVTIPVTTWAMGQPHYAPQEFGLGAVLAPQPDNVSAQKAREHRIARTFTTERRIAAFLDRLDLPDGSVITDTIYGFAILAATRRPRVFVIPSDPDFTQLLNEPEGNGIRYLLAVPTAGRGTADALNLRYPTLYNTGSDVSTLEMEFINDGDGQPDWRLYRVNEPVPAR
ncbi:ArnT family glycosyltransferase [Mycolicibacterium mengxianglii]|uniref:ArnT family glycosyltransferase n=1 Tax=Mycolicibacterium mengxianglii TaxID=2736649 RepID=UPI0018EEEAC5|nr:phospholipid carrier-dependent glycosyltransferase [Mycolicibacterium mengxianglii]